MTKYSWPCGCIHYYSDDEDRIFFPYHKIGKSNCTKCKLYCLKKREEITMFQFYVEENLHEQDRKKNTKTRARGRTNLTEEQNNERQEKRRVKN